MPKIAAVALLLVLAGACDAFCDCPDPPLVQSDSVMIVGSDSVMHVGSDSTMFSVCRATIRPAPASRMDSAWVIVTCGPSTP